MNDSLQVRTDVRNDTRYCFPLVFMHAISAITSGCRSQVVSGSVQNTDERSLLLQGVTMSKQNPVSVCFRPLAVSLT